MNSLTLRDLHQLLGSLPEQMLDKPAMFQFSSPGPTPEAEPEVIYLPIRCATITNEAMYNTDEGLVIESLLTQQERAQQLSVAIAGNQLLLCNESLFEDGS